MNVVALVGGEFNLQPDDISLAHNGASRSSWLNNIRLLHYVPEVLRTIINNNKKENADSLERR